MRFLFSEKKQQRYWGKLGMRVEWNLDAALKDEDSDVRQKGGTNAFKY